MVIVDDSTLSFGFQLDNGIPIVPYKGEKDDAELLFLYEYLEYLKDQPDMAKANRNFFRMHYYRDTRNVKDLMKKLFK